MSFGGGGAPEGVAFGHSHDLPLIAWFGLLTAALRPLVAAAAGLPLWAGLLVAAGVLLGVPLFGVQVVERFSARWAVRICEWHMAATCLAFGALVLAGVGAAVWRWVAG